MSTATFVRTLSSETTDGRITSRRLYRFDPPITFDVHDNQGRRFEIKTQWIVSTSNYTFGTGITKHEACLFPADQNGTIVSTPELYASVQETTDHDRVIRNAGYQPVYAKEEM